LIRLHRFDITIKNSFTVFRGYMLQTITKITLSVLLIGICTDVFAQSNDTQAYSFLKIPTAPTIAALGGIQNNIKDVNGFFQNPALVDSSQKGKISLNFMPYFQQAKLLSVTNNFSALGRSWGIGVQYLDYGDFVTTDPLGNQQGQFNANDFAVSLGTSQQQGNIRFGASLKLVGSTIEQYNSTALLADFGAIFIHPTKEISYSFVVKNFGFVLKDYSPTSDSQVPLDVQMGLHFKPINMPARFSLMAHHLYKYDIAYTNPNVVVTDLNGNVISQKAGVVDQIARHLVFGVELLFSKNLQALIGYNHLRNRELSLTKGSNFGGFSVGLRFKTRYLELSYSYSGYHASASANSFGLILDLKKIVK
jgi:hypothetical protein